MIIGLDKSYRSDISNCKSACETKGFVFIGCEEHGLLVRQTSDGIYHHPLGFFFFLNQ
jgi:hypothetical protein